VTSTHRSHGHTLTKGAGVRGKMSVLQGRATGSNGGKGGSMHIAHFSVGMLGANGVAAAGLPIACGAAHALKIQRRPQVVACFFGDGAINRSPIVSVIDLGMIWPWYRAAVLADRARIGHLLVMHEAVQAAGFGAEVAATAAQALGCRVARLGAPRVPVGYAAALEAVCRIDAGAVLRAARESPGLGAPAG